MFGLGIWELTLVFAIILVLFGGKRLPHLATGLGQAIRNFQTAIKGENKDTKLIENENNEST